MVEFLGITTGIAVGLGFLAIAIFERGFKTFLEERKVNPGLKFDGTYFLNILMTAGSGSGILIILSALPGLIQQLTEADATVITLSSLLTQAILGYTVGYRILDGLNTRTEARYELAEATKTNTTEVPK